MDYKHTIVNGHHVIIVDYVGFSTIAVSAVFKGVLTEKFPDANDEFIIGYMDDNETYTFESPQRIIITQEDLDAVPDEDWEMLRWG